MTALRDESLDAARGLRWALPRTDIANDSDAKLRRLIEREGRILRGTDWIVMRAARRGIEDGHDAVSTRIARFAARVAKHRRSAAITTITDAYRELGRRHTRDFYERQGL